MKTPKQTICIVLVFSMIYSCSTKPVQPASVSKDVDRIVNPYIVLGAEVGVVVGTIQKGKRQIYSYGEKELGSRQAMTAQSVLEIASLTKTYTALALAQMVHQGLIHLNDPIERYLPSTVKIPSFEGQKITLRHLANHTSGFPRDPQNMDQEAYNKYKGYTEEKMYSFINGFTLSRAPGTRFEYSNVGYGLLGEILSRIHRSDYETMIEQTVLQPLGMQHSSVSFRPDQMTQLVRGYHGSQAVESWSQYMQNIVQGTGSLISNIEDQMTYMEAQIGLKPSALDTAMQLCQELSFSFSGTYQNGIGLGWSHYTLDGQKIIWKNGGNGCYSSFMGFDKATQTGVVVMANSSLNPDIFTTDIGFEVLKALQKSY